MDGALQSEELFLSCSKKVILHKQKIQDVFFATVITGLRTVELATKFLANNPLVYTDQWGLDEDGIGVVYKASYWDLNHPYVHEGQWTFQASTKEMETIFSFATMLPLAGSALCLTNAMEGRTVLSDMRKTFLAGLSSSLGPMATYAGDVTNILDWFGDLSGVSSKVASATGALSIGVTAISTGVSVHDIWKTEGALLETLLAVEASGLANSDNKEMTTFLVGFLTGEFGRIQAGGLVLHEMKSDYSDEPAPTYRRGESAFRLTDEFLGSDEYASIQRRVEEFKNAE